MMNTIILIRNGYILCLIKQLIKVQHYVLNASPVNIGFSIICLFNL